MSDRLPSFVDPFMMADKNAHLEGKIALSSLDRLSELLVDDAGDVIVRMDLAKKASSPKLKGISQLCCR